MNTPTPHCIPRALVVAYLRGESVRGDAFAMAHAELWTVRARLALGCGKIAEAKGV